VNTIERIRQARLWGLLIMATLLLISALVLDFGVLHRRCIVAALLYCLMIIVPSLFFTTDSNVHVWSFLCRWSYLLVFGILFVLSCFGYYDRFTIL
jgi:hypothetical protein